jgi:hypothetical protein
MDDMEAAIERAELKAELAALRQEVETLRAELDEMHADADLEACHVAGLTAQLKALIAEGDACPKKESHPLLVRESYVHARTGETITKTRAFPLYREAFDAEARRLGIDDPEKLRA